MKVEEAKTKICPFTLYAEKYKDPIKPHNISYETKGSNCICDECMAWEWENKSDGKGGYFSDCKSTTDGYCKRIDK